MNQTSRTMNMDTLSPARQGLITVMLSLAALLANHWHLPLYFGVDLIFGSSFVVIALLLLGWRSAMLVALVSTAYTLLLWGHGYAMVIFLLEAAFLSYFHRRGQRNILLIDCWYWLLLGVPMVLILYHWPLGLGWPATLGIAFKQPFNALLNITLAWLALALFRQLPWARVFALPGCRLQEVLFYSVFSLLLLQGSYLLVAQAQRMIDHRQLSIAQQLDWQLEQLAALIQRQASSPITIESLALVARPGFNLAILNEQTEVLVSLKAVQALEASDCGQSIRAKMQLWLPCQGAAMQRWQQGYFWQQLELNQNAPPLVLHAEHSAMPLTDYLSTSRTKLMAILLIMAALSLLLSWLLSHLLSKPLKQLSHASLALANATTADHIPEFRIESGIQEYQQLQQNLGSMQQKLAKRFENLFAEQEYLQNEINKSTQALQQSELFLRQITESSHDVFWLRSGDLRQVIYISPNYEQVFGRSCQSLIEDPNSFLATIHPDDQAAAIAAFEHYLISHRFDHCYRIQRPDGQIRWIRAQSFPVFDDQGKAIRHAGVAQDITSLKLAEQRLAESSAYQLAIVNSIIDGVITIDCHGLIQGMNPAAEQIFGYQAEQLLGQNVNVLMPEPYHSEHDQYLKNYLHTGNAKVIGIGREVTGLRANGEQFAMELAVAPVQYQGQLQFVGTVRDIGERKRIETLKNQFVATVSHELRTPLTAILGGLGLVLGTQQLSTMSEHLLHLAQQNSQRMMRLINDLLDFEKLAAGRLELNPELVALPKLLQELLAQHQTYALEKQIALQFRPDPELDELEVLLDGNRLQQILANLLSNAIKFSPARSVITVSLSLDNHELWFRVQDQGPGISDELAKRLFQRFSQGDSSDTRQQGGSGLGLAISQELARLMNGELGYHNLGSGCEFWLKLKKIQQK